VPLSIKTPDPADVRPKPPLIVPERIVVPVLLLVMAGVAPRVIGPLNSKSLLPVMNIPLPAVPAFRLTGLVIAFTPVKGVFALILGVNVAD
jgi:hypothetical protein